MEVKQSSNYAALIEASIAGQADVICGTLLSAVLSVPVAYWAARNTSPHPAFRWLGRTALLVIAMVLLVEALAIWIRKALAD